MHLTEDETLFLTALLREQSQSGCRGPAHDLLREHAYPDAPRQGRGSLAFSYEAAPLANLVVAQLTDLEALDDFLRKGAAIATPPWPWASPEEYHARLEEARKEWTALRGGKPELTTQGR